MDKIGAAHWNVLGATRFALASIVLCKHLTYFNPSTVIVQIGELCAYSAVIAFLMISGFSIAHSIGRNPQHFYVRRILRIYPLYILAVLSSVDVDSLNGLWNRLSPRIVIGNLFFLQTYRYSVVSGNAVLWTVAVEVLFYLLAPFLAQLTTSILAGIMAVSAAAYLVFPHLHLPYYLELRHGQAALFLGWAWLAGFVFYRVRDKHWAHIALICGVVTLTSCNDLFTCKYHEVTLLMTMIALIAGGKIQISALAGKVLGYLGDLSFPLYLFHFPVMFTCIGRFHLHSPWLVFGLCFVVSAVMLALDNAIKKPLAAAAENACATLAHGWGGITSLSAEAAEFLGPTEKRHGEIQVS